MKPVAKRVSRMIAGAVLMAYSSSIVFAAQNTITNYEYDAVGNRTKITNPLNPVITQSYDSLNRLTQQNLPPPVTGGTVPSIKYSYDLQDQIKTVTDPRSLVTTYTVTGLGDTTSLASPDTGSTVNTFDNVGNLKTSTDARGKVSTYTYDAQSRVTNIAYTTGTATQYEYDGGAGGTGTAIGHLTKMTDESGTTTFTFNGFNDLLTKTQTLTGGVARTVTYTIGTSGSATAKVIAMTYPSGNRINYSYDAAGRISALSLNPTASAGSGTNTGTTISLISGIGYKPFGPVANWTWGNSTPTNSSTYAKSYDLDGRITSYNLGNATQGGLNRTLTYDAASRILYYDHTGTNHGNFQLNLAYDNLDRLTTTSGRSQQTYTYDLNGNRTQSLFGSSTYTNTVAATSNRMTAATGPSPAKTYQFDAAGNITSDGTNSYSYSDRGRLASATTAAGTFVYKYNGFGQRVLRSGPSAVIATGSNSYFYDEAGHLIGEYDASNKVIEETVYLGNTPIAVLTQATSGSPAVTTTSVYNVYADHLNSPVVITRTSDNQMVWRRDWYADAYGMSGPNQNPASSGTFVYNQRFAGQIFDKETNLNHNGFRDYDPVTGRYLQSDPIGLSGGVNTYAYVGANPVSYYDQDGLQAAIAIPSTIGIGLFACNLIPGCKQGLTDAANEISDQLKAVGKNYREKANLSSLDGPSCTAENGKDPCQGLRDQIQEHERKLNEYMRNPLDFDNKGFLSKARQSGNLDLASKIYITRETLINSRFLRQQTKFPGCSNFGPCVLVKSCS